MFFWYNQASFLLEWLPTVVGLAFSNAASILPIPGDEFYQGYNPDVSFRFFLFYQLT
jgi:hypothetical protein